MKRTTHIIHICLSLSVLAFKFFQYHMAAQMYLLSSVTKKEHKSLVHLGHQTVLGSPSDWPTLIRYPALPAVNQATD